MRKANVAALVLSIVVLAAAVPVQAQGGTVIARLRGFEEVPSTFTPGIGFFAGSVNAAGTEMTYELGYSTIEGNVTQAHLHAAQRGVNGGIVVFLCSNLSNAPAGIQACPATNGTISGTITAADVLAVPAQSIGAGELFSVLRGIRAGTVYANVHTDQLPGGSIRGQLRFNPTAAAKTCCLTQCIAGLAGSVHPKNGVNDRILRGCTGGHVSCSGSDVEAKCDQPDCDAEGDCICDNDPIGPNERQPLC